MGHTLALDGGPYHVRGGDLTGLETGTILGIKDIEFNIIQVDKNA